MLFREVVSLVTISESATSLSQAIDTGTATQVYADEQSVRQSEFYQAVASGMNPEKVFVVRTMDYSNQALLKHGTDKFKIIRTFNKPNEMTELVCERLL